MTNALSSVEKAVEALASGRLIIVVDSVERENEGDFVAAAETITPQAIHFMISQGRGQVCMPLLPSAAKRLKLQPMVRARTPQMPNFTIPIDHRDCKTGISPLERAATIRAVVDGSSRPEDFVRPGHLFPLIAREGGVLTRPGHTEAAVDLAAMAGLSPFAVLCEICSNNGLNMAGRQELMQLAARHELPILAIDDLISYRRAAAGRSLAAATL